MGVKKLLTYLIENEARVAQPLQLPRDDGGRVTVLVDAYALWIKIAEEAPHFMEDLVPSQCMFPDADVVGGDCFLATAALARFVSYFRDVCGVDLVFVRDGPRGVDGATSYRDAVWNKREAERLAVTQRHYDYCTGDARQKYPASSHHHHSAARKPLPHLLFRAMAGVLQEEGIPVVVLDGEVDAAIGAMFHAFGAAFVIASDTDFAITADTPLLLLQQLPWPTILQDTANMGPSEAPPLPLVTAGRVASSLDLADLAELRLLACLMGNDATNELTAYDGSVADMARRIQQARAQPVGDGTPWFVQARLVKAPKPTTGSTAPLAQDVVAKACSDYVAMAARVPYQSSLATRVDPSLLQLYRDGKVPSRVLPLAMHRLVLKRPPPWALANDLGPALDRAEKAVWRLLGLSDVTIVDAAGNASPQPTCDVAGDEVLPLRAFLDLRDAAPRAKREWLMAALTGTTAASDFSFRDCVLWLLRGALHNDDELLVVALMLATLEPNADARDAFGMQRQVFTPQRLAERPFPRCLEMSRLVAHAHSAACDLYDLLGMSSDVEAPQRSFSGTLLHCFFACYQLEASDDTWRALLPASLLERAAAAVARSAAHFPAAAYRSDAMPPRGVRSRVDWIGLLQRDEVVDFLDGGTGGRTAVEVRGITPAVVAEAVPVPERPLPILEFIAETLDAIDKHPVVCIQGDTGCGKSSMVPLKVYEQAQQRRQRVFIVVTQPRRLAALSLAKRVASLLHETVGETVGYRIGGGETFHRESAQTKILFVTTGYLLEALVHGSTLWSKTTHFILDEVHERSIESDMLSLVIKLSRGASEGHQRLVLMSATLQAELFSSYFQPEDRGPVPTLQVGCRRYHVEEHFIDATIDAMRRRVPEGVLRTLEAYSTKVRKCKDVPPALRPDDVQAITNLLLACVKHGTCILVFLPGLNEIEAVFEELTAALHRLGNICTVRVCALHSVVEMDEQHRAVEPSLPTECKIVLATNIAETSITIPDAKIIVDLGMARRVEYNQAKKIRGLVCGWCSKSAMRQRAGRAGRVSNGVVYRLYPEETAARMRAFDDSEFMPLELSVLQVHAHLHEYGDVRDLMQQLPEPPNADLVDEGLRQLIAWGALAGEDLDLTALGKLALRMPIDVSLTRAVYMAAAFGCAAEMVVVAAGFTLQRSLFQRPLRTFYDNDYDYIATLSAVDRAMAHFDRHRRSDLYIFVAIFEEATNHARSGARGRFGPDGLAGRQVSTFVNYVRNIASRLLQPPAPALDDRDRAMLASMAARDGQAQAPLLHFPIFTTPANDLCFQLVLAANAEIVFYGHRKLNTTMHKGKAVKGAILAPPEEAVRTVVFDGVDKDVLAALPPDVLRDHLQRLLHAPIETVTLDSATTLRVVFRAAKDKDDAVQHSTSLTESCSPPAAVQTLLRVPQQHPAKKQLMPFRTGAIAQAHPAPSDAASPDSFPFPAAKAASTLAGTTGMLQKSDVINCEGIRVDKWSALFGAGDPTPSSDGVSRTQLGCGFAVMQQGQCVYTSMAMLLCTLRSFPFVALITAHRQHLGRLQLGLCWQESSAVVSVVGIRIATNAVTDVAGAPLGEVAQLANTALVLMELVKRGRGGLATDAYLTLLHRRLTAMLQLLRAAPIVTPSSIVWVTMIPRVVSYLGGDVTLVHDSAMGAVPMQRNPFAGVAGFAAPRSFASSGKTQPLSSDDVADNEDAFRQLEDLRFGSDTGTHDLLDPVAAWRPEHREVQRQHPQQRLARPSTSRDAAANVAMRPSAPAGPPPAAAAPSHPKTIVGRPAAKRDAAPAPARTHKAAEATAAAKDDGSDDEDNGEMFRAFTKGLRCKPCNLTLGPRDMSVDHPAVLNHTNTADHIRKSELWLKTRADFRAALGDWLGPTSCYRLQANSVRCTACSGQSARISGSKDPQKVCKKIAAHDSSRSHKACLAQRSGAANAGPQPAAAASSRPSIVERPAAKSDAAPTPAGAHGPVDAAASSEEDADDGGDIVIDGDRGLIFKAFKKGHKSTSGHIKKSEVLLKKRADLQAALKDWLGPTSCFRLEGSSVKCSFCTGPGSAQVCSATKDPQKVCRRVVAHSSSAHHLAGLAKHSAAAAAGPQPAAAASSRPPPPVGLLATVPPPQPEGPPAMLPSVSSDDPTWRHGAVLEEDP